jgi:hypothetical protein
MLESGIDEVIQSLDLMSRCMTKSPYGDTLLGSVKWLKRILEDIKSLDRPFSTLSDVDKWNLYIKFLLWTTIKKDFLPGSSVSTLYQQAKENVVDLLKNATSEEAMISMLTTRFDPSKYLRPDSTKTLSDKQLQAAIRELGEFTNRVFTARELDEHPECITLTKSLPSNSSLSGFAKMAQESKSKSQLGFASRCGITYQNAQVQKIKTLDQLVTWLKQNPASVVEVRGSYPRTYLANTTLRQECRTQPHFWAVYKEDYLSFNDWTRVTHIQPMYRYIHGFRICFFRTSKRIEKSVHGNCCFPQLLSPAYQRVCGLAFEKLNTTTSVITPSGDIAHGFSVNTVNADGKLTSTLNLRVNSVEIKISEL